MTARTLPALDIAEVEAAIGVPFADWAHECHAISLAIVKARLLEGRVARGTCTLVGGQHSWVVVGDDCYAEDAVIVDPVLWSYDPSVQGIWVGSAAAGRHAPHGHGNIWTWGRPPRAIEQPIELAVPLSKAARDFLALLGPLDRRGWALLTEAPVGGWPAAEVLAAMDDTPDLCALVPIDRLGMLTDRNPGGAYLA